MLDKRQTLKNEMEKMELEQDLAVAQAREKVYADVADEEASTTEILELNLNLEGKTIPTVNKEAGMDKSKPSAAYVMNSAVRRPESNPTTTYKIQHGPNRELSGNASPQNVIPNPFLPSMQVESKPRENIGMFEIRNRDLLLKQNELMTVLTRQHQESLLPNLTLTKFSGDPIEYVIFVGAFESQIEARLQSSSTRLRYLEQYLDNEPKELIKGCLYMDADIGYLTAKKLLDDKYGDPYVVSNAYLKKVLEWPSIKTGDDAAVDRLATFLEQCLSAMTSLSYLNILDHPHNLQRLIVKLPFYLQDRWRREAIRIRDNGARIPSLKDFTKFVQMEAKIANDPVFSRSVLGRIQVPDKNPKKSGHGRDDPLYKQNNRATKVEESQDVHLPHDQCPYFKETHDLDDCQSFVKRTLENRKAWLKEKNMCFACFNAGHRANGCLQRRRCRTCPGKHPTSLHDPDFASKIKKKKSEDDRKQKSDDGKFNSAHTTYKESSSAQDINCTVTTMPIVPVKLIANEREVITYAMLDSCSTGTFILEDVRRELQIEGTDTNVLVNTMNGSQVHQTKVVTGLIVTDIDGNNRVTLPRTFSRDTIPASKDEIPTEELVAKWKHLSKIELPSYLPVVKIRILIGSNCPKAIEPKDFIVSEDGGSFAVKTFAGWTVVGSKPHSDVQTNVSCNRTLIEDIVPPGKPFQHHFVFESKVKEIVTPQELNQMFELEFSERPCIQEYGHSIQDKAFLKKMVEECKFKNGHYELPLPFVDGEQAYLPSKRMESLKRKLLKNPSFHADYEKFMSDLLSKDYARIAPAPSRQENGKIWYLPHHGVYHPRKPNKVRVVFDCSAKYLGISLNDTLMQGTDLTNSLVGVLLRFRQSPVAFTADIESMYYQVRVPEDQRDFLRFLWWPDGDLSNEVKEYQMNVHIFGAVSSPSCANFGLNQAANDSEQDIGAETCNVLRKNFYVDDCLRSEETEDEAITRIDGVRRACSLGGFRLTKFVCNRSRVLNTIPESERAKQVKRFELRNDNIHLERVLGVDWLVESDAFGFRIVLKDKPLTRRGILATVSSIYDPLGMAAPFQFVGKTILQDLCKDKAD